MGSAAAEMLSTRAVRLQHAASAYLGQGHAIMHFDKAAVVAACRGVLLVQLPARNKLAKRTTGKQQQATAGCSMQLVPTWAKATPSASTLTTLEWWLPAGAPFWRA